jgi:hypothetical protein
MIKLGGASSSPFGRPGIDGAMTAFTLCTYRGRAPGEESPWRRVAGPKRGSPREELGGCAGLARRMGGTNPLAGASGYVATD